MKALIDTHVLLWWDSDPGKLSAPVLALLQCTGVSLFLSVVSIWEIIIKQQSGKLTIHRPLPTILAQQQAQGIQILSVALDHVMEVANLPAIHKDPFDRLLIAQARVEGLEMVTADANIVQYPVTVFW